MTNTNKYGLVNRTKISNAVDTKLYEKLTELSKETMIPISKLLDKAITLLLDEYDKK
ncbi:ribbon-helix-helix domain-containing protein (plasmid) [Clostridium tyrobutyricum]|jgi:hypothetical protein|uniref:ribbon-helix-helix domain-containing protein n=1 Tax=Clostridium tyrobutyricum TaxID=1519 RepID=UPI0039F65B55